jgi:tetratricopeptide (TPR) repeat protein
LQANWGPDPRLDALRKAVQLVREADELRRSGKFRDAQKNCNDALALAPNYGAAMLQKSKVALYYLGTQWDRLTPEIRINCAEMAYRDSEQCIENFPEINAAWLIHGQNMIYLSHVRSQPEGFRNLLTSTDLWIKDGLQRFSESERGFLCNLRAQCHQFLGELKEAEKQYDESVRLAPTEPRWYLNRAQYWDQVGKPELAVIDRQSAQAIRDGRDVPSPGPPPTPALPANFVSPFDISN